MSNMIRMLPEEIVVGRGDPVYMAHAYLTKVPVPAILPFIEAFTKPGDVILDPFAGSGMTGVAAASAGRRAELRDISVLGRHIGRNYVNLVDPEDLRHEAERLVKSAQARLGPIYRVDCDRCGAQATLAKAVWSSVVECGGCKSTIPYYEALEAAAWAKSAMQCPACDAAITARLPKVGEQPVTDSIQCACSRTQLEQKAAGTPSIGEELISFADVEIGSDRQMYKASALGRHNRTTVGAFYSRRNLAVLSALHEEILALEPADLREKLLFAFTACLTRASKRYQWSRQRPLNAANANYYVAPVFYEWNVFDLFGRKIEAIIRSDDWVRTQLGLGTLFENDLNVHYELGTATAIDLPDQSVDYVFTDPPFGSNLFYADMALFQEAWLGEFTDVQAEAVIDRGHSKTRTADHYEEMLTAALADCRRVIKPGGRISMVFGNSSGHVWSLVERSVRNAGLVIDPDNIVLLNKGQRSVKGLASGFEHIATLDLVLTMTAADAPQPMPKPVPAAELAQVAQELLSRTDGRTASHLYLELLRVGLRRQWDLGTLDLSSVVALIRKDDYTIDASSAKLERNTTPAKDSEATTT